MKTFYREDIRKLLANDLHLSLMIAAIPLTCVATMILIDVDTFWRRLPSDLLAPYLDVPLYAYAVIAAVLLASCLVLKRFPRTAILLNGLSLFFLLIPLVSLGEPIREIADSTLLAMWAPLMLLIILTTVAKLLSSLLLFAASSLAIVTLPKPRK